MFKSQNGKRNLCGLRIAQLRKGMKPKVSQRMLEDRLQLSGMDLDKNAISKIESGQRFVTDIELKALAELFHITTNGLLYDEPPNEG